MNFSIKDFFIFCAVEIKKTCHNKKYLFQMF